MKNICGLADNFEEDVFHAYDIDLLSHQHLKSSEQSKMTNLIKTVATISQMSQEYYMPCLWRVHNSPLKSESVLLSAYHINI